MKLLTLVMAAGLVMSTSMAIADDSQRLVRSVSAPRGETQNPEPEGEHAFIKLMNFHVPAQSASGELRAGGNALEYVNIDDVLVKTEEKAKPLINVYVYGPVIGFDEFSQSGFPGHGKRDAFGAVSLDDGETWKVTNLSNSADKSSFTLTDLVPDAGDPVCHHDPDDAECTQLTEYPGEANNVFHAVAGNRVLVAWQSKFCSAGFPGYTGGSVSDADALAGYLGIDNAVDMYLTDLFGVAGSQGSTDYKEQEEFDGEYDGVGEVPWNCLWAARGVLRENPDAAGTTELVWFQAERLTSGRRDVNRVETACVAGAGCAISWQEDPKGLRPGEGEGPGTGWAGATTNSKTDIWYSFIEWEDMNIVDDDGAAIPLADNILDTGRPKPYVPMMVPVRLSNNDRCKSPVAVDDVSYCNDVIASAYGIKNQCVGTIVIPAGHTGNPLEVCVVDVNETGEMDAGDMPNLANTAASRPRLNLQPRDTDGDDIADDAWVIIVHEEDKGLGRYAFENDELWDGDLESIATGCGRISQDDHHDQEEQEEQEELEENCVKADTGKNQWYISFALGTPQTSVSEDDIGMVDNLVAQQNQYNAPEVNWRTGTFYPPMSTADMWDFGNLNYSIFNTEIARRASLMSQSLAKAENASSHKVAIAMPLFKEGIINQGGPADIMARRIVYNNCPIHEEDPEGPVISKVDWVQYLADGENIKIKGTVSELDEAKKTGFFIRDAVNYPYVFFEENTAPKGWENFLAENMEYPPCYIQVSDENPGIEGASVGNWGVAWDLTEAWEEIGVECECIIPEQVNLETNQLAAQTLALPQAVASTAVQSENPYDFSNMECAWYDGEGGVTEGVWLFDPETDFNPYYPKGLCTAPAINLSGRTPNTCEASGESDGVCPGAADMTCTDDLDFGQLCLSTTDPEDNRQLDKLISWYECPGWNGTDVSNGGNTGAATVPSACYTEPDSALLQANLDDRSWYNPIDISKAHRGFLDGDFISMIYAWSPNWKLNTVGRDRYELFTRRSFDGGVSWTTTPDSFAASNGQSYSGSGTVTCETWRDGVNSKTDSHICTEYAAGDPEQSRNVTQHKSMKITTLDPRYTPTVADMAEEGDLEWGLFEPIDPTDIRDPSRYFVVFETGDNTTVAVGEAEPLNLDYGRAENFGDHFTVWSEIDTELSDPVADCYPSNAHDTADVDWAAGTGFCNEFDTMEGFPLALSEEASVTASAYGDFLYGVWGQFNMTEDPDTGEHVFVDGDSMFRRIWYLDDYISTDNSYTLPGTQ